MNYVENIEEDEPAGEEQDTAVKNHNLAAIRMPKEHLDFVKRNPKLAQTIGKVVIARTEIKDKLNVVDALLGKPSLFEVYLEDGTKEELTAFLSTLVEQQDSTVLFKNLSKDDYEKVQGKFAEAKLEGVITNCDEEGKTSYEEL